MSRREGQGLERLVDLDGVVAEVGGGFWVKIVARRVTPGEEHPYGVSYSLTLHDSGGQRVFGIDNAHLVRLTRGPAGPCSAVRNHLHRGESVRACTYRGADALLDDFWREVEAILKREGVE